jgi:uncharacterized membrane protein YqjE
MTTNSIQPVRANEVQVWSRRSDGVTVVAVYHFIVGGLFLVGAVIMAIPTLILGIITLAEEPDAGFALVAVGLIAVLLLLLSLVNLAVGYGLWVVQPWGRTAAIVLAVMGLIFFPIGTIAGAFVLWYLLKPEVAARFG